MRNFGGHPLRPVYADKIVMRVRKMSLKFLFEIPSNC